MNNYKSPILITGAARSGTSMTAGIINMCDAFGGKMSGATPYNKKGMFENHEIRQDIVKSYLRSIKADPMGQNPLPTDEQIFSISIDIADRWKKRVLDIMIKQGLQKDQTWFYKGAKMCLMWPLWDVAFQDAKWIIVRRESDGIINSCMHTGFMRAFRTQKDWLGWVQFHENRFKEMKQVGLDIREVWPEKMINGDFKEIEKVVMELGLLFNEEMVKEFISPELWSKEGV